MEPARVALPERKAIGLRFSGPFEALGHEVPKLWAALLSRLEEIPHQTNHGVYLSFNEEDLTYGVYSIHICVEVACFESIPVGMIGLTLPASAYVQYTHEGPMSHVQDSYMALFTWMEQQGVARNPLVHGIEQYDDRYVPSRDDNERLQNAYDIFIPLTEPN